ncbi:MAG: CHAT domain-containing protein [Thermodesulfobacteriota bacterium]
MTQRGALLAAVGLAFLVFLGCEPAQPRIKDRPPSRKDSGVKPSVSSPGWRERASKLMNQRRFVEAASVLERGLAQVTKAKGSEDDSLVQPLLSLCQAYTKQGEYARAEDRGRRALAILEKKGSNLVTEPQVQVHSRLGRLYLKLGDYAKAERHLELALAAREKLYGPESPGVGYGLMDLGVLALNRREYRRAEDHLQRALTIFQAKKGPQSRQAAEVLKLLGRVSLEQKKYDQAESYFRQALNIIESAKGPRHPDLIFTLTFLGALYVDKGDYGQAEPLLHRALAISDAALGPLHPDSTNTLVWLAILQGCRGEYGRALETLKRVQAISDRVIEQVMGFTSEEEKMSFLETRKKGLHVLLNLAAHELKQDQGAVEAALSAWLKRKGIVLEAQKRFQEALIDSDDLEAQKIMTELDRRRAEMSRLVLGGVQKESTPEDEEAGSQDEKGSPSGRPDIARLEVEIQDLESRLSRQSRAYASNRRLAGVDTAQTAASLPPDSVLLEFASSRAFSFGPRSEKVRWGKAHYLVFILPAGRVDGLVVKDLGEASVINRQVTGFKKAMTVSEGAGAARAASAARRLYDLVWAPLKNEIGSAKKVFISPDGRLNLIPFEAFLNPEGRYLIEDHTLYYLTSGRDLLSFDQARTDVGSGRALLLGDPDFWLSRDQKVKALTKLGLAVGEEDIPAEVRSPAELEEGSGLTFQPLPGTRTEVKAISALLGSGRAEAYLGTEAIEEVLRQARAPRILHLATHGFFLEDLELGEPDEEGKKISAKSLNPLLRSGLALAGANQSLAGKGHDGILTAEKVLGLKLRGTELVVLSACETGLGETSGGEGVFGLRRAFAQVGVKSMVMSMWPVPDRETTELIVEFYQNLTGGRMDRGEALRRAALKEMKTVKERYGHGHPFFWGAFVFLGQP